MSKLIDVESRLPISAERAADRLETILRGCGCSTEVATEVTDHLVDASLSGVESHGIMRVVQYAQQYQSGYLRTDGTIELRSLGDNLFDIDGGGGIGIPAMRRAADHACEMVQSVGLCAIAIRNAGHTGRLGAFADRAASRGCLTITLGGGNRKVWRQVAPHGGRQAKLPTNPYCIGIPGGDRGPVVLDFATAKIAGGWVYAANSAGAKLPEDVLIDADGNPSTDPADYFDGGAILPSGGPKGYALALVAELIAEAMLGPTIGDANTLMIALNTSRFSDSSRMQQIAEEILADMRNCPPALGFERVEVPGERERETKRLAAGIIQVPEKTWLEIESLASDWAS